ncbi:MAG: flagellar assembly protein FliW [Verrucomicrobia bacterium]|nr:flagellar assembly protein FliW [Verrucomicrobiota bacterium]
MERQTEQAEKIIQMPLGLLGFEGIKQYVLRLVSEESPFLWFQVVSNPQLAFLVMSPFVAAPDYRPDIDEEDTRFLELENPEDAVLFNIVTLHRPGVATVNLKGPIVINRNTLKAMQVVPANASELPCKFPLPISE